MLQGQPVLWANFPFFPSLSLSRCRGSSFASSACLAAPHSPRTNSELTRSRRGQGGDEWRLHLDIINGLSESYACVIGEKPPPLAHRKGWRGANDWNNRPQSDGVVFVPSSDTRPSVLPCACPTQRCSILAFVRLPPLQGTFCLSVWQRGGGMGRDMESSAQRPQEATNRTKIQSGSSCRAEV